MDVKIISLNRIFSPPISFTPVYWQFVNLQLAVQILKNHHSYQQESYLNLFLMQFLLQLVNIYLVFTTVIKLLLTAMQRYIKLRYFTLF